MHIFFQKLAAVAFGIATGLVSAGPAWSLSVPLSQTLVVGGIGPTPYNESCLPGEVLSGLGFSAKESIDQVTLLCVAVDSNGMWIGSSVQRSSYGTPGENYVNSECPSGHAVIGFNGSSGNSSSAVGAAENTVGYVQLRCGKLTSATNATTSQLPLDYHGVAASDLSSVSCTNGYVANGIHGSSGTAVNQLGLNCTTSGDASPGAFGQWSPVVDWPLVAIHAVLTPEGKVLTFGTDENGVQGAQYFFDIWDPELGFGSSSHYQLDNSLAVDLFCSAPVIIPNTGDIILPGGDQRFTGTRNFGISDAPVFNTQSQTLSRAANMGFARWYPNSTVLQNGEILLTGGIDGAGLPVATPEIYNPVLDEWRSLFGATSTTTHGRFWWYPRQWLAPDGRVFGMSTNRAYYIDATGSGLTTEEGFIPASARGNQSTSVMFRPGEILQVGRGKTGKGGFIADINSGSPIYRDMAPVEFKRERWSAVTVLADGAAFLSGGSYDKNELQGATLTAELWNPGTETWSQLATAQKARLYHSTQLLLPDGRVLRAGGGSPGPITNLNSEIFSPPYLFHADGSERSRIVIDQAPDTAVFESQITATYTGSSVARVTLVRTGAMTHGFDMDQRFIELPFVNGSNEVTIDLPNVTIAPPGFYMLHLLDVDGTPSKAKIIKLDSVNQPPKVTNRTPSDNLLEVALGEQSLLTIEALDDKTSELIYDATISSGGNVAVTDNGDGNFTIEGVVLGSSTVTITITDKAGLAATEVFSINTVPPRLTDGATVAEDLLRGEWDYYTIDTGPDVKFVRVYLDGLSANANLYVRADEPPTETGYDCRPRRSNKNKETCVLDNASSTTWHVGVKGMRDTPYVLSVELDSVDHATPLISGNRITSKAPRKQWVFYAITTDIEHNTLQVTLDEMTANGNLYLSKDTLPTHDNFACRSTLSRKKSKYCEVKITGGETWYIGVYGVGNADFTLTAVSTNVNEAPVILSRVPVENPIEIMQGDELTLSVGAYDDQTDELLYSTTVSPQNGVILTDNGAGSYVVEGVAIGNTTLTVTVTDEAGLSVAEVFNISTVPQPQILQNDSSIADVIERGEWSYYIIEADPGVTMVRVYLDGLTANANLYVRENEQPTNTKFSCRSRRSRNKKDICIFSNTGSTTWHVGVKGIRSTPYTISVEFDGPDYATQLISGNSIISKVLKKQWSFYSITTDPLDSTLNVTLEQLTANANLYLSKNGLPSAENNDCQSLLTRKKPETCEVETSGAETWYIGVYGVRNAGFTLTATTAANTDTGTGNDVATTASTPAPNPGS